jgi:hypothetical protein
LLLLLHRFLIVRLLRVMLEELLLVVHLELSQRRVMRIMLTKGNECM